MSKIGKLPITIPEGVEVELDDRKVKVTGPKGSLERKFADKISFSKNGKNLLVLTKGGSKKDRQVHGTSRAIAANMIRGVVDGWKRELELVGTGYRAEVSGPDLVLTVGFSHPVKITAPEGITFSVAKTVITVEGIDKELVGSQAANIRRVRPPEPYKGKA